LVCGLIQFQKYDERTMRFRTFIWRKFRVNVVTGLILTRQSFNCIFQSEPEGRRELHTTAIIRTGLLDPAGSRRVGNLRRLSGAPTRRFADRVIPALGTQTNASCALALGKVLIEFRAELTKNKGDAISKCAATSADLSSERMRFAAAFPI
jgi:hypothetical protein